MSQATVRKQIAVSTCSDPECQRTMLRACPAVRMGRVDGNAFQAQPDGTIAVVPPVKCIGCGICVKKCKHGHTRMVDW